jgi:hypothetical protein
MYDLSSIATVVLRHMQEGRRMWSARRRLAGWGEAIYDLLQQRYAAKGVPEDDHSLAGCLMRVTDKHGNKVGWVQQT